MISAEEWKAIGLVDVEQIGRGGFGIVYRAVEDDLGRTVAVKVLPGELDDRARDRFDRERRAMAVLSDHPHIVPIFRSGFLGDGSPFLVMEHVSGGSMAERISAGPLPWQQVVRLGVELSGALETAHRSGVLHRDVKPGNILLSALGAAKLADFGIARLHGAPETRSASVTASVAHAPPEVVAGRRPDHRADVYSLASTLFELLTGGPPFVRPTDESLVPVIARIAQDPVPDLRDRGVPSVVCAALEQGMAKDPSTRTQTAVELGRSLQMAERDLGLAVSDLLVVGEAAALPERPDATTDLGSVAAVPDLPPSEPLPVVDDRLPTPGDPAPTGSTPVLPPPSTSTPDASPPPTLPQDPPATEDGATTGEPPPWNALTSPEVRDEATIAPPPVAVPWWKRPAVLAGAAAAVIVAVIGVVVLGGDDPEEAGPALTTAVSTDTSAAPATTSAPPTTTAAPPPTTAAPTTAAPPPTTAAPTTAAPPPSQPGRTPPDLGGVFSGDTSQTVPPAAGDTIQVSDDTGAISMSVPAEWNDLNGVPAEGASTLIASPDISGAIGGFTTPGVLIQIDQLLPGTTVSGLLDFLTETECVSGGRAPFAFEDFVGEYEVFGGCAGTITAISHTVMISGDGQFLLIISSQAVAPEDIADIGVVLGSLNIDRTLVP
ncbi:MAG: serine/threonine-protein kinase [Actinomycetota bacterium]